GVGGGPDHPLRGDAALEGAGADRVLDPDGLGGDLVRARAARRDVGQGRPGRAAPADGGRGPDRAHDHHDGGDPRARPQPGPDLRPEGHRPGAGRPAGGSPAAALMAVLRIRLYGPVPEEVERLWSAGQPRRWVARALESRGAAPEEPAASALVEAL